MSASVLVVDDEPQLREVMTELLAGEGYRVRTAADGVEAWEAIAADTPDLLLTDDFMPGLGGRALVDRLRAAGQRLPIVLLTATSPDALPDGVVYLGKPFDLDELLDIVARLLTPSSAQAAI